jgi:hypothetical protein
MAGCRSCSGCAPEPSAQSAKKAEKLEKVEQSGNPRYPHVLIGKQAIYSDEEAQLIVTVLSDDSDEACDCFQLKPQRILKDVRLKYAAGSSFEVSQAAGEKCWKLSALL